MRKIKKAEMTTQQIVGLTILIISFGVLLFFLTRLNLQELTDKEICHNSVILNEKNPNPFQSGSLDCRTSYICISGGGDCKDFSHTSKREISLVSDGKINKERIMKQIAEEMSDCWWMFGEGKLEYVKLGLNSRICAMCSVIAFDEKIQNNEELSDITYKEFYDFLGDTDRKDSEKYLKYLYNSYNKNEVLGEDYLNKKIILSEQYFILTGMGESWTKFLLKYGFRISFIISQTSEAGEELLDEIHSLPITILEKTQENFEILSCDKFITKA